jgi:hypothetical protein
MERIAVAQIRDRWWAPVNAVKTHKGRELPEQLVVAGFPGRTLLQGVIL